MADSDVERGVGRALLASGAIGAIVVDPVGRLLRVNPWVERLTGYAAGELRGRPLPELLHADDAATVGRLLGAPGGATPGERTAEARVRTRIDGLHWVRLTVAPDPAAPAGEVVVLLEDLSQRRDLALRLTERVKELSALHQAAQILGDAQRSRDQRIASLVGLLPAAMQRPAVATASVSVGGARVTTPGHRPSPWRLAARGATVTGDPIEVEVAYHAPPEGAREPFLREEHALLVSIVELIGSALDRDATVHEVALARDRHELALAAAGMALWEWNLATNTAYWSRELAELTGEPGPLAAPLGAREHVVHPDDRAALWSVLRRLAEEGGHADALRLRLRRADGAWRTMQLSARGGGDRRVVGALVDVTARQALEEGLRQAQRLEALGLVAGAVAHDFASVLAVVRAGVERLRDDLPADDERRATADEVREAAHQGAALARQLLAFARRGEFAPSVVAVNDHIRRLEPMLRRLTRGRAELVLALAPVGAVWVDPAQLEQVLIDLVANARDAVAPTGGRIEVSTAAADAATAAPGAAPCIAIAVRDDGAGIPDEVRARIFEPFFTTKGPGAGTGLGLAVVASVARQWGGRVELESAPGRGTTLRLLLPVYAPPVA